MSVEIFKSGTRRDHNGNEVTISDADVAAVAAVYDAAKHEAPIVIGHPSTDAPAYGWIKSLSADAGRLHAEFGEVDEGFTDLVRAGRYKKVSASFYTPTAPNNPTPGKWYLRHVGFLGAVPPAVKGLKAVAFADGEEGVVDFNEYALTEGASLWRSLRDWLIAKFGLDEADKVIPDWRIESIKELAGRESSHAAAFSENLPSSGTACHLLPEGEGNGEITHDQPTETSMSEKETQDLQAALARAEKAESDLAAMKAAAAQAERLAAHQANADFAEDLSKKGLLKPADKELVIAALDFADHPTPEVVEFGEGEAKKPLAAALRDFLAALPPVMEFAETATAGKAGVAHGVSADFAENADAEALNHHERATALMKQEGISYEAAARRTAQ